MSGSVQLRVSDHVARISLCRPPLNILDTEMIGEINLALESVGAEVGIRLLVFQRGPGTKAFSAGVDIADHTRAKVRGMIVEFHRIFRQIEGLSIPTLAIVEGAALGGGCELATFCDLIVATEGAKFGQPEVKVGVFPPIAAITLPRRIPRAAALEYLLTGETMSATQAHNLGLINRVVSAESLQEVVVELTDRITSLSSVVGRYTRRAVREASYGSFEDALSRVENLYLDELMESADAHEGLAAFMEKRPPRWRDC